MSSRSHLPYYLAAAAGALFFSSKGVVAKLAYPAGVDALTLVTLRMAFALPVYLVVAAILWRRTPVRFSPREWGAFALLSVFGFYLSTLWDFEGLQYINAGLERLIIYLYPTLVVLLSAALGHARLTRRLALAVGLSYGGILLVCGGGNLFTGPAVWKGAALVGASAITYAIFMVFSAAYIRRLGPFLFTSLSVGISTLMILAHFLLARPVLIVTALPDSVLWAGLYLGVAGTVAPTFLINVAIRRIGPGHTAVTGSLGPVFTIFLAAAVLGEHVTVADLAGTALVLAGGALLAVGGAGRGP